MMDDVVSERYQGGNVLIDALPESDRRIVVEQLNVFRADVPDCVVSHGEQFADVLFPIDAIFSITAELRRGNAFEVAAIGRLGMVGAEVALGTVSSPRSIMSQVDGRAARMSRDRFAKCVEHSVAFARGVQRHILRRLFIAEQFIACNFAHSISERCARWILMLTDELGREEFELRHEFLGMMLGLPAGEVQAATQDVSAAGAIRYSGERLTVLDRDALLDLTCECYEAQLRYWPASA
jgi:CRP-like cAMP-binding protein